ncbi:MAG: O-antigen ligase family protein [Planctomycetes bacterium]|nr:O-antigen ligase family protein [Planctomycetota bacterium]
MQHSIRHIDRDLVFIITVIVLFGCVAAFAVNKVSPMVALGVTLGIVVFLTSFIWPPIALYILILSMLLSPEFGQRSTHGDGATIRLDDLLLVVIGFSWFAKAAVNKELGLFPTTPLNRGIIAYIIVCLLSTVLGAVFGKVHITGFMFVLKYIEYYIVFFMAINCVETKKQVNVFIILLLVTSAIISIYAISQIPSGERVSAPFEGKTGEPGTLGGYLLLILSVGIGLFLTSESRTIKVLLSGLMFINLIALMATQSRAAWIGLPFMYLCFIIMSKKRVMLLGVLAVIIAISPLVLPKSVKERFSGTFITERGYEAEIGGVDVPLDASASERVLSWQRILNDYKNHPILGYGVTGYGFIDSQYFRTLVELGIVGLSIYLFLMYQIYRFLLESHRIARDNVGKGLTMGLLAGLTALLLHAIGSNTFIIIRIMEPFWFFMGLVFVLYSIENKRPEAMSNEITH